jgi:hypothetical protein
MASEKVKHLIMLDVHAAIMSRCHPPRMTSFRIPLPEPPFLRPTLAKLPCKWAIDGDRVTIENDELARLMRSLMPAHLQLDRGAEPFRTLAA